MLPGRRRFEIQLSSKSGPIDVFLIQEAAATASAHDVNLADPLSLDTDGDLLLKPFDFAPTDPYVFGGDKGGGPADFYGTSSVHGHHQTPQHSFNSDVFNVFSLSHHHHHMK
jgi:hypothetical protein